VNTSHLGKIPTEQRAGEWPVWQPSLHNPSFAAYAKLCGGKGFRVTQADQLEAAIAEALLHDGPALVEIITDAELI
jgi:thiamine pyrophosphate-dependent acetolactate synthase large subunit-like protein